MTTDEGYVDLHHHYVPPSLVAAVGENLPPPLRGWSIRQSLSVMDDSGVARAVLSLSPMGRGDAPLSAQLARECNEYAASMVREHRGRFAFFAWLPLPDVEASLNEVTYALDVLGASGIGFFTGYGDRWAGDPHFAPVYEELDRRGCVAYFHPRAPLCCSGLIPGVGDNFIEYPQDSGRAAMGLLFSGTLARHRRVRWLFSHAGGPIPIYASRVATLAAGRDLAQIAPDGIVAELARLHFETANAAYAPAMSALLSFADAGRIYFGTDYPFVSVADNVAAFSALALETDVRAAIAHGNAGRLLNGNPTPLATARDRSSAESERSSG